MKDAAKNRKPEKAPPQAPRPPADTGAAAKAAAGTGDPEIDAVLRAIGFIFFNTVNSRWFSIADCVQTIRESFSILTTVLDKHEKLRFTAANDEIKVNGDPYEIKTQHVKALVAHFTALGGCNFTFAKGTTDDEFGRFLDLISRPQQDLIALGDFTDAVTKENFQHISSKKIVLREVSEEETVIDKQVLESVAEEEKKKIESDVLALLSAERHEASTERTSSLRQAVQDSEKMADLIMQTVDKKQGGAPGVDKKEVAKIVVECLDRAFQALLDDPFSKTQKGKKAIASALQHLETELLTKMQIDPTQEESKNVSSAVERMTERLKMDSVVQDYTKKLRALEDSEKQILRFIKLQGLDRIKDAELEKKLSDEGMDVSDLHRLLAMSGAQAGDEAAAAVTQLAALLARLDKDASELQKKSDPRSQEQIAGDLKQVNSEVSALTEHTQTKISGLVKAVTADMEAVDAIEKEAEKSGKHLNLPRRKMLAVLAEVIQELCQPLSVIACSIDMLKAKTIGDVSAVQLEVLQLVSESAEKIRVLISNLEGIAGYPMSLHPDEEIVASLNKQPGQASAAKEENRPAGN